MASEKAEERREGWPEEGMEAPGWPLDCVWDSGPLGPQCRMCWAKPHPHTLFCSPGFCPQQRPGLCPPIEPGLCPPQSPASVPP